MDSPDLFAAAMDIERHVASQGWDQPALLFALVPTERIRADQPELAAELGVTDGGPALTTFEQPAPPDEEELDEFLARIEWPAEIVGAALVVERLVLPPGAEAQIADRPDAAAAARAHPDARDMRIVAAVTRDGDRMCVLRLRGVVAGADDPPAGKPAASGFESDDAAHADLASPSEGASPAQEAPQGLGGPPSEGSHTVGGPAADGSHTVGGPAVDGSQRPGGLAPDAQDEVLTGPDLVPGLADALLATFH